MRHRHQSKAAPSCIVWCSVLSWLYNFTAIVAAKILFNPCMQQGFNSQQAESNEIINLIAENNKIINGCLPFVINKQPIIVKSLLSFYMEIGRFVGL